MDAPLSSWPSNPRPERPDARPANPDPGLAAVLVHVLCCGLPLLLVVGLSAAARFVGPVLVIGAAVALALAAMGSGGARRPPGPGDPPLDHERQARPPAQQWG